MSMLKKQHVITYQTPAGQTITLAERHVATLEAAQVWPRDSRGHEYCTVYRGYHAGYPTLTDAEIASLIAGAYLPDILDAREES